MRIEAAVLAPNPNQTGLFPLCSHLRGHSGRHTRNRGSSISMFVQLVGGRLNVPLEVLKRRSAFAKVVLEYVFGVQSLIATDQHLAHFDFVFLVSTVFGSHILHMAVMVGLGVT